ncbi:MAG: hypothetical protein ABIH82_01495 [Candidatus Woesearchaeota archaeon]
MIKKRTIAKIQFIFGIVLLLATIVSSIFIVKDFYLGRFANGVEGVTEEWGHVNQQINGTTIGFSGLIVNNVILQGEIVAFTGMNFMASGVILIVLSIISILQGLYNLSKK